MFCYNRGDKYQQILLVKILTSETAYDGLFFSDDYQSSQLFLTFDTSFLKLLH